VTATLFAFLQCEREKLRAVADHKTTKSTLGQLRLKVCWQAKGSVCAQNKLLDLSLFPILIALQLDPLCFFVPPRAEPRVGTTFNLYFCFLSSKASAVTTQVTEAVRQRFGVVPWSVEVSVVITRGTSVDQLKRTICLVVDSRLVCFPVPSSTPESSRHASLRKKQTYTNER